MHSQAEDKKNLLSNFFSLSTLQGLNMLLPLITLPYLVRVLGIEIFGLISFSLSIIMYFNILVSFGFDLSATREISINRTDREKISEIFSAVMFIKTTIAVFSLILLSILIMFVDTLRNNYLLYYTTFGVVLGNVVFPLWFFQGMERMNYITYINVVSKTFFTILIFLLVKQKQDFIYVPALNSLGAILGGLYSLWLVYKLFDVRLHLPNKEVTFNRLKDSYHFFLSRVANSGSRYYAITIIGLYFGNIVVGYYSLVEKMFYALISIGGVISQTIYPYMSRTRNIVFFKTILLATTMISILVVISLMYFNEELLEFVFNVKESVASKIFLIVFSGAVFGIISGLLGYPLLAAFGHVRSANNSLIYASLVYIMYITITVLLTKNIFLASFSVSLYMITGLAFRLYYVTTKKIMHKVGNSE
jgi:polysaccharide transporter, PST family